MPLHVYTTYMHEPPILNPLLNAFYLYVPYQCLLLALRMIFLFCFVFVAVVAVWNHGAWRGGQGSCAV